MNEAFLKARIYPRPADMKWSKNADQLMVNATVAIWICHPVRCCPTPPCSGLRLPYSARGTGRHESPGHKSGGYTRNPVRLLALAAYLPAFLSRPLMVNAVGGGRGEKMPSFNIDLHAGRGKSEVEWLNVQSSAMGKSSACRRPSTNS